VKDVTTWNNGPNLYLQGGRRGGRKRRGRLG
jgi:hypothetical protein